MINQYHTKLIEKKPLTPSVFLFKFHLDNPLIIDFIAGQYLFLKLDGKTRLYSIASSSNQKNQIEFVIEIVEGGLASTFLKNLSLNDEVIWYGPAGQFCLKKDDLSPIFFVTGTGIAPIRSMILSHIEKDNFSCLLLWGLRKFSDLYFFDEFLALKEKFPQKFNFIYCLSREEKMINQYQLAKDHFFFGHLQDYLEKNFREDFYQRNFYLCGSRGVVESLKEYLKEKGFNDSRVIFERF